MEFVKDRATKTPLAPEEHVGPRIHADAVARGLFSRVRGEVFVLAPSFVTPDNVLDGISDILDWARNFRTPRWSPRPIRPRNIS